jgi:Putative Flp pilus-assembly TadE/G-like
MTSERSRSRLIRDECGTMTLWVLGLCIMVLFLGGLSLDLWRVIAVRRSLVAMADAGATAGANGIDEVALRQGVLRIDPTLARAHATETLEAHAGWDAVEAADIDVVGNRVTVTVQTRVGFTLLGIFVHGDPIEVDASASAEPREEP